MSQYKNTVLYKHKVNGIYFCTKGAIFKTKPHTLYINIICFEAIRYDNKPWLEVLI